MQRQSNGGSRSAACSTSGVPHEKRHAEPHPVQSTYWAKTFSNLWSGSFKTIYAPISARISRNITSPTFLKKRLSIRLTPPRHSAPDSRGAMDDLSSIAHD